MRRIEHNAWGFIALANGGDAFFNKASVYGPEALQVGDSVVLAAFAGGGAPRAHPVIKVSGPG